VARDQSAPRVPAAQVPGEVGRGGHTSGTSTVSRARGTGRRSWTASPSSRHAERAGAPGLRGGERGTRP
jgi:hypothetical protein